MVDIKCLYCGEVQQDEMTLHRHIKSHGFTQNTYYLKCLDKRDRLTGEKLPFKSRDSYLDTDFICKENLKQWLRTSDKQKVKEYIIEKLTDRKTRKNITYTLSQIELRSLIIPGIAYMNSIFEDYYREMHRLGFKNKFREYRITSAWKEFDKEHRIIVDSREQLPLEFSESIKTIHSGLKFGDYKLNDDKFSHNCCIERKSMVDFYGTLSSGLARFQKELEKAREAGYYMVVLIEEPFTKIYDKSKNLKRVPTEYVLHNMRAIIQSFDNVQFLFVEDRTEAAEVIEKLFLCAGKFKDTDLQCAYDTGGLI